MTINVSAIADLRPRIRQDVVFSRTRTGVLFHNADGGFHFAGKSAYRLAGLLVPRFDGATTVGEICALLPEAHRAMVVGFVSTLADRGFVRDYPAALSQTVDPAGLTEVFAAQLNYLDHYADEAGRRFMDFRRTRVAVLGDDSAAHWSALSLIRNGLRTVTVEAALEHGAGLAQIRAEAAELTGRGAPADVRVRADGAFDAPPDLADYDVVVCAGRSAAARIHRLVTHGVPDGTSLLPVVRVGGRVVVGPTVAAGVAGCWLCAMLRIDTALGESTGLWRRVSLPASDDDPGTDGVMGAMIGNYTAYEVFRQRTGALEAETSGRIMAQDLESLDMVTVWVAPDPRCPRCSVSNRNPAAPGAALPRPERPARSTPIDADDDAGQMQRLSDTGRLVHELAGVFQSFEDDAITQTPLKASRLAFHLPGAGRRTVSAFDMHHVAGARIRVVREAARRYMEHVGHAEYVDASVGLRDGATASGTVVRAETLDTHAGVDGGADIRHRMPARSVATGVAGLVPAAAVVPFGPLNAAGRFVPTTAGTGVGDTPGQALADALASAITFRALTDVMRGRHRARAVPADCLAADAELAFLAASARNLDAEAEVLDISVPGLAEARTALALVRVTASGEWFWAAATDGVGRDAVADALRDALGAAQLALDPAVDPAGAPDLDSSGALLASFDPATVRADGEDGTILNARDAEPARLPDALAALGIDAWAVARPAPDLEACGVHVVKVLLAGQTP